MKSPLQNNRLFHHLVSLLVTAAVGVGCNPNLSPGTPTEFASTTPVVSIPAPTSTATEQPTPKPTSTLKSIAALIPTPIPTHTLLPVDSWPTYRNQLLRYELKYPPQAVLSTAGVTGYPIEELPTDMEPDEFLAQLEQTYAGDLCVSIQYRIGFVTIKAAPNEGGKYTDSCGVTGVGDYDVKEKTETVMIGNRPYSAQGFEVYGRGASATFRSEFFIVHLEDGTRIDFGSDWTNQGKTYEDYLPVKEILLKILASYRRD
jgi:hypothetical protein